MNSEKFSDALGEIDEKYIDEVMNYSSSQKLIRRIWKVAAACVAVAVLVIGIAPYWGKSAESFTFVLTAYAAENNTINRYIMQEGEKVPISVFETESGLKGFVFSYDDPEPKTYSTFSIMSEGQFEEQIHEITALEQELGKHYLYYVPEQDKTVPYEFMIPYTDLEANIVYLCYLVVEENEDGGYTAVIDRLDQFERRFKEE